MSTANLEPTATELPADRPSLPCPLPRLPSASSPPTTWPKSCASAASVTGRRRAAPGTAARPLSRPQPAAGPPSAATAGKELEDGWAATAWLRDLDHALHLEPPLDQPEGARWVACLDDYLPPTRAIRQ